MRTHDRHGLPDGQRGRVSFAALVLVLALVVAAGVVVWQQRATVELPAGFVSGNGRIEATSYDIATPLGGRLLALTPQEGDQVAVGEEVGSVDDRQVAAQLQQAQASLEQARQAVAEARVAVMRYESETAFARATFQRTRDLVERNFLSPQRLDQDRNTLRIAEAALDAAQVRVEAADAAVAVAEAALVRARAQLDDTRLVSPIAGRVLYRLAEPGVVLAAGARVLTVIDLDDMYMTVFVPADHAGQLPIGAEARIRLDAWSDHVFPARVSFVAERAQFTPREVETRSEREKLMFRVKLSVDPELVRAHADLAKPGMPAVAFIRLDASQPWPASLPR
ncbi:MAG: HlyD family secretion protein [Rhodocyclaceae bacterium]